MEGELNMHTGTLRQILVITDGESNQGKSPVAAAAEASEFGYTVNVIKKRNDRRSNRNFVSTRISNLFRNLQ